MSLLISFRRPTLIILYFTVTLLFSCEYEPPEKFTEVSKEILPPELTFVSADMEADTLYICGTTNFSFSLISSSQPVVGGKVTCLNKTFNFSAPFGTFEANPTGFTDGAYKVVMEVYTRSGSGSLADAAGAEGFLFSKEWVLVIERPSSLKLKFLQPEIENGFLKIKWERFPRKYFQSYTITVNDSSLNHGYSTVITNADQNFLVDSSFVGGSVTFSLQIKIKDCGGTPVSYHSDQKVFRFPISLTFLERIDTLEIKWTKNPFRHTANINVFSQTLNLGTAGSYKMRAPGIGGLVRYNVFFRPTVKLTWTHQVYNLYANYSIGKKSSMEFYRMAYLPEKNIFLVKHPMYLRRFNGSTLEMMGSFNYSWDYHDDQTIAISPDMTSFFTTNNQNVIRLNNDFQITDRQKFQPSETSDRTFELMRIINDSLMFIGYDATLSIYNYRTRKEIRKISIWNSYGEPYNTTISKDGKYIANCSNTYLRVFRNDADSLVQIYSETGNFYQCIFDPVNAGNLYIMTTTEHYVVHCPDMARICTFPSTIRGYGVNFDPVTNDLLMVSSVTKKITIYDYLNNVIRFQCMHHGDFRGFYLANGTVYHESGYYIDKDYEFYEK